MDNIKDFIKYIKKHPENLAILGLSLAVLIVGAFITNFFVVLLLVLAVNLIWVIPYIKMVMKKKPRVAKVERKELEGGNNMAKKKRLFGLKKL